MNPSLIMESDTSPWFDQKYRHSNLAPSIDDILAILTDMKTQKLPDRVEETIKAKLDIYLFELEQKNGYTSSRHIRTQFLLELISAFEITEPSRREGYKERFKRALQKHKDKIPKEYRPFQEAS